MIDLHALLMNNFEHRVFSIEPTAVHARCINLGWSVLKKLCTVRCWICLAIKKRRREPVRDGISLVKQDAAHEGFCWTFPLYIPLRSFEQFRTQGFLRIESTAVQRYARKSTEFATG